MKNGKRICLTDPSWRGPAWPPGVPTAALILLFILAVSCSTRKDHDTTEFKKEIEDLLGDYHNKGLFDGCALVGDTHQVVFKGAFGMADRGNRIPLSIETQFYLASVSKQFTASAVLKLAEMGKINLDDKIILYLPDMPEIYAPVTFRHLLNHTSGIPDYYEFAQLHEGFTNKDVFAVLIDMDSLHFEPGTEFRYSNSGYVLLSILVREVAGIPLSAFLREKVFNENTLHGTVILDEYAEEPNQRAIGYDKDGSLTDYSYRTTGGGGIFSNVLDLYQWHKLLISGAILNKQVKKQAYKPARLKNDSLHYYGYGWWIDQENPNHVWHDGELEGFRTRFDRRLDDGRVIILLSNNSSTYLEDIAQEIWERWPGH